MADNHKKPNYTITRTLDRQTHSTGLLHLPRHSSTPRARVEERTATELKKSHYYRCVLLFVRSYADRATQVYDTLNAYAAAVRRLVSLRAAGSRQQAAGSTLRRMGSAAQRRHSATPGTYPELRVCGCHSRAGARARPSQYLRGSLFCSGSAPPRDAIDSGEKKYFLQEGSGGKEPGGVGFHFSRFFLFFFSKRSFRLCLTDRARAFFRGSKRRRCDVREGGAFERGADGRKD